MTKGPALMELVVPQRATFESLPIWLPFSGVGVQFYAQGWDSDKRRRKLMDFQVVVDNPLLLDNDPDNPGSIECEIRLRAGWTETRKLTRKGYWDLLAVFSDDTRFYALEGPLVPNLNATEAPAA